MSTRLSSSKALFNHMFLQCYMHRLQCGFVMSFFACRSGWRRFEGYEDVISVELEFPYTRLDIVQSPKTIGRVVRVIAKCGLTDEKIL